MIPFKIVSGFYHNLTYSNGEIVNLDFNKIQESDIQWFGHHDNKYIFKEKVNVIYNGKSRIDNSPIFSIDVKKEIRNIIIDNILN